MLELAACELLEWDSDFFGFPIARATPRKLTPDAAAAIDAWSERHRIRCTYLLAGADDPRTARVAHEHAFRFIDVRMTLAWASVTEKRSSSNSEPAIVRPARPDDVPALEAIARVSHHDSRFYQDGGFPVGRCDELYATWIRESCAGGADAVLVADTDQGAGGYVTCHRGNTDSPATIGLLAVGGRAQGHGIGRALVEAAQEWFRLAGVDGVKVVTQARNVDAQRVYQGCGFRTDDVGIWYHRWYGAESVPCS